MHVKAAGDEAVDYLLDLGVGGRLLAITITHGCGWFPFAGLKTGKPYQSSDLPG